MLAKAQGLYGHAGEILGVIISNRGSGDVAVALSDQVVEELEPVLQAHQLEAKKPRQDAI